MLGWDRYFLKDYVKSLKTGRGAVIRSPEEAPALVEEMRQYRGEIEGGICVRRVEEFVPQSERRFFVLFRKPFAAEEQVAIPEVVAHCAAAIPSPFYSVDVVLRADGVQRVVELGDGQVSDAIGWTTSRFVKIWSGSAPQGMVGEGER